MLDSPLFAVSQFTTWHQSFEEDVELYTRLGVKAIEICERKLSTDSGKAIEQLAMVKDAGLSVTSVQPRVHALFNDSMCPHLHDPDERIGHMRQTIDLIAKAFPGQDIALVTISGNAPDLNFRHAHQTARRLYPQLADYAADHGLRIMFEPHHPIFMSNDAFICTFDEACRLIGDVERENFGLMFDTFHLWHEPMIAQRLVKFTSTMGARIFGVHLGDWPADQPRHIGDRVLPGAGITNLPILLGAIERTGYNGAYCLEIFSVDDLPDSLWKLDPAKLIARGRAGFEKAWANRQ